MKLFRLIIFSIALLAAGYAVTYTWLNQEKAEALGNSSPSSSDVAPASLKPADDVTALYPFSRQAIDARKAYLEAQLNKKPESSRPVAPDKSFFKATFENAKSSVKPSGHPYVNPDNLAVLSLAILVLALILPGTRFRGTSFIMLLLFAAAALPEFMPEASRISFFDGVGFVTPLYTHFPHIAFGFLGVSLLLFMWRKCSPVD